MRPERAPRIAVAPEGLRTWLAEAVVAGGGRVVHPAEADGLVWTETADPAALGALLAANPGITWVQLPWAGIEAFGELLRAETGERTWTCGKGVYAEPVAEMALTMLLGGLRHLIGYSRVTHWSEPHGRNLIGARITIVGGGGITESLLRLLAPFEADVTVVRRHPQPMPGVARVVGIHQLDGALDGADALVLALALTPETRGIIGAAQLERLPDHAWIVNVARGAHLVTDDLVAALEAGTIGGAALDVTVPEPLPAEHRLWSLPNCLVTPHVGNTPEMAVPLLSTRVSHNVRRFAAGEPLIGLVDTRLGY